jgi:hypothetical protein
MTISKKKKIIRRLFDCLDSLREDELSKNKGDIIRRKFKLSKKDRRNSGKVQPYMYKLDSYLYKEGLEAPVYYDDWVDYRDGFRDNNDRDKLRKGKSYWLNIDKIEGWNKKLIKQIRIKNAKRDSPKN